MRQKAHGGRAWQRKIPQLMAARRTEEKKMPVKKGQRTDVKAEIMPLDPNQKHPEMHFTDLLSSSQPIKLTQTVLSFTLNMKFSIFLFLFGTED